MQTVEKDVLRLGEINPFVESYISYSGKIDAQRKYISEVMFLLRDDSRKGRKDSLSSEQVENVLNRFGLVYHEYYYRDDIHFQYYRGCEELLRIAGSLVELEGPQSAPLFTELSTVALTGELDRDIPRRLGVSGDMILSGLDVTVLERLGSFGMKRDRKGFAANLNSHLVFDRNDQVAGFPAAALFRWIVSPAIRV